MKGIGRAIALASLAIAVGVAGCGSEDSTGSTAPSLSRAQFVAKANELCERERIAAEHKAQRVFESKAQLYLRHGNFPEFRATLTRQETAIVLAPSLRRRVKEVRSLGLPAADEDRVSTILRTIGKEAERAMENPPGFAGGTPFRHARSLARSYGIESCAVLYEVGGFFQRASARPGVRFKPRSSK